MSSSYPQATASFAPELMDLLDKHHAVLEPPLRQVRQQQQVSLPLPPLPPPLLLLCWSCGSARTVRIVWHGCCPCLQPNSSTPLACAVPPSLQTLVKALILLRNRQQLAPTQLLPLLFRLFRVQDKALRQASNAAVRLVCLMCC